MVNFISTRVSELVSVLPSLLGLNLKSGSSSGSGSGFWIPAFPYTVKPHVTQSKHFLQGKRPMTDVCGGDLSNHAEP